MTKKPENSGKPWTKADVKELKDLAAGNTPTRIISLKMKRTPAAILNEASKEKITLKPTNQSPYGNKSKKTKK